ncbi:hypothetical protein EXIGLDRAFT_746782 [Exidia glandulosa HHB12029]|uniref:LIM zinc-binding domain-containing protein n=1 Tax=Exidia glandulosa HHB12029 TaxID=1314781 RepID=A0A165LPU8_EXIGL|nr:hypothetical protein EXIGLDRAFT_746782 [Exidia glandulosa HHB12029]
MSSSYTSQPHYQAGQQPQPAQGYYNQAQAPQGAQGQQWPQYATQQPAAQQQPYTQAPYAQPQQQQAYTAPGYDYAAYYAQQQQWAAYHQQQQQQRQRQPGQQQAQPQYAQPVQQQPQAQPQYSQQQQYAAQQQQQQPPPAAASANSAAYYQQHYAQRQPQQQPPQQQQPQQQQQYQQTVQYQQPQQQQQVYAQPTGAHYAGVQQQHQQPAPVAPAGYPAQQPVVQNPVQSAYTTPQHVVQQAQPVQQNAGYAPATTALHQPQPHAARRPLPSPATGTPPRSPVPPVATGPAPVPAAAAVAPVPVPVPAPASRPPSQSYPNLPNVPTQVSSLPRNTSLPSTSTQGSPTKSGGRPLPLAPGGENSPPVTPINVAPPPLPTRAGTLPDGPVRSFRNRRGLPTGGAATPSSILSRGSTLSGSPQKADEPLPNVQRSYTLPTPNTSTRPLPAQPPGSDAPSLTVQQQLMQHQQQQALTQAATTASSQAAPPRPTVVTAVPTPAQPTEPSPSSARSAATDIDDRPPPSSRLSRSPLPELPQQAQPQAQRRQSQPPPQRTQQQQQPQQRVDRPQSQQYHPPPVQPQQQQPPQRLSRIMQMAMQNSSASQTQNSWPSDLPPLPRPPKPYVHGRIESDDLQDVVAGTLDLELDDAPPQPARPLSRAGRDLPSVPPSVPEKQGRDRGASVSRGHSPRVRVESMPSSPQISVSGPSIAVRAPSPGIPSVAIRAPSPSPSAGVPSISIGGAPSISVSSAPSISVSSAPSINVPAPPMVLSIQLDAPEPGLEATRQRVDVHKLPPVHRGGDTQCGGCGRQLLGRLVSAMDVRWHPQCFKCALCETLLEHVSVFTYEDRPFCHFDYMEHFAPRCHHCKTPIVEEQYITIEDPSQEDGHRFYHEHHFFCAECGDPFIEAKMKTETDEGKEYTMHNNHAYCQKCHINLRYPKCKKCRKPMAENMIEAFGSRWHWECFTCTGCDKPFEDPQMFERDGKPYCLPCFDILIRNDV